MDPQRTSRKSRPQAAERTARALFRRGFSVRQLVHFVKRLGHFRRRFFDFFLLICNTVDENISFMRLSYWFTPSTSYCVILNNNIFYEDLYLYLSYVYAYIFMHLKKTFLLWLQKAMGVRRLPLPMCQSLACWIRMHRLGGYVPMVKFELLVNICLSVHCCDK